MRFLVDAQLPPALARWLSRQGLDAKHVLDYDLAEADDRIIWQHAASSERVIITKDEDFALRRMLEETGPPIVWIRVGNTRKKELLRWFEPLLPEILAALQRGDTMLEIA